LRANTQLQTIGIQLISLTALVASLAYLSYRCRRIPFHVDILWLCPGFATQAYGIQLMNNRLDR